MPMDIAERLFTLASKFLPCQDFFLVFDMKQELVEAWVTYGLLLKAPK